MDRPRDSIAAVVRSRHGPTGGAKFTTGWPPRIVRSHSLVAPLLLHNLRKRCFDDKMVTIMNRTVTSVYLFGSCNWVAVQPRNLIARMNWEFERYANVENLEFIHVNIVICQTEEDLMKVKSSNRLTMFLDDKTEMVGVVTKPNEESMEYAQASGSLPCGCVKEPKYRHCRMRACKEEYDVCSYLPRSLIAWSELRTGIKCGSPVW